MARKKRPALVSEKKKAVRIQVNEPELLMEAIDYDGFLELLVLAKKQDLSRDAVVRLLITSLHVGVEEAKKAGLLAAI